MIDFGRRAFVAAAAAASAPLKHADVKPTTIAYGTMPEQVGDLYLPHGDLAHRTPVVALLHGGFWQAPYTRDLMHPLAQDLCRSGVAVWNLEYRRCGAGGGFPTTLMDVAAGVDFLADSSVLDAHGLDGTRVALVGHSAGAQLALWVAQRAALPRLAGGVGGDDELTVPGAIEAKRLGDALRRQPRARANILRPRCVVSAGGVLDLAYARSFTREAAQGRAVDSFLGTLDAPIGAAEARLALCSPIDLLPPAATSQRRQASRWRGIGAREAGLSGLDGNGEAAFGLVHGLLDDIVPAAHSTRMCVAAAVAGIGCTYHQIRQEGHFDLLEPSSASWRAVRDVLERGGVLPARDMLNLAAAKPCGLESEALPPAVPGSVMARTKRTESPDEIVISTRRANTPLSSPRGSCASALAATSVHSRSGSSPPSMCLQGSEAEGKMVAESTASPPPLAQPLGPLLDIAQRVGTSAISSAWRIATTVHRVSPFTPAPPRLPDEALRQLDAEGYAVIKRYVSDHAAAALRKDANVLQPGAREAGVGTRQARRRDEVVRRCRLLALEPPPTSVDGDVGARLHLSYLMRYLSDELSHRAPTAKTLSPREPAIRPLDARATELYYAYYATGGHYVRHLDVPASSDGWSGGHRREVSVLLYLDQGWQSEWGGALRIFDASHASGSFDVLPEAGTLVLLRSDRIEHEVTPTLRPRTCVVGWLRATRNSATPL